MVQAFERVAGRNLPHEVVARRAGDLATVFADASLAENELGWKAERSIDDAMRDTLHYLELRV